MKKNKYLATLFNGLLAENPTFVQLIGMCPTLAVTTTLQNGVTMGIAATLVLVASNVVKNSFESVFVRKVTQISSSLPPK